MSRTYRALPEAKTGYALDNNGGFWSVVVPTETTNLVPNPHNKDSLSMSAGGALFYEDTTEQAFYEFSQRVEPDPLFDSTVYYAQSISIAAGAHTFSIYIKAPEGLRFNLNVTPAISFPPSSNHAQSQPYTGTGAWKQYHVSWMHTLASSVYLSVYLLDDTEERSFYLDAWQLEALPYPTTFCDGDRQGYSTISWIQEYKWNGTPHSSTSTRSGLSRSGGRVVNLRDEAFFHTTEIMGAGIGEFEIYETELGSGQKTYNGARNAGRELTISGVLYGDSYQQLQLRKRKLINLFRPDLTPDKQPVLLRYQPVNINGESYGSPLELPVVYTGGLQGQVDNHYRESMALTFKVYDNWREVTQRQYFADPYSTWTGSTFAFYDNNDWDTGTHNFNGDILASAYDYLGRLMVGGAFTTINGSTMNRFAIYDGTSWSSVLEFNGTVRAIAQLHGPNNTKVAIGGDFTQETISGTTCNHIIIYDFVTGFFTVPGTTGLDDNVHTILATADGSFYLGGEFYQNSTGVNTFNYIAYYNGSSLVALGASQPFVGVISGFGGVRTLAFDGKGDLYVGGVWTGFYILNDDGVTYTDTYDIVGRYVPSEDRFYQVGNDGLSLQGAPNGCAIYSLAFAPDGSLYVGGLFTHNSDETQEIPYLARYRGGNLSAVPDTTGAVRALGIDIYGNVHVGGLLIDPNPVGDSYYSVWNGTTWIKSGVDLYTGSYVYTIAIKNDTIAIGAKEGSAFTAYGENTTEVTYNGTAETYPVIALDGTGTLSHITNLSTGANIYFEDLSIYANETVYIDLNPGKIRVYSNFRSNLISYMLPSSNASNWKLLPGTNLIKCFYKDSANDVRIIVHNRHHSFDMAGEIT